MINYLARFKFGIEFCLDDILITSWNLYYLYLASRIDLMETSSSSFPILIFKIGIEKYLDGQIIVSRIRFLNTRF